MGAVQSNAWIWLFSSGPVGLDVKTLSSPRYQNAGDAQMAGEGVHAPMGCILRCGFQGRIQNLPLQFGRQHPARALAFLPLPKCRDAARPKRRPRFNHRGTGLDGLRAMELSGTPVGASRITAHFRATDCE